MYKIYHIIANFLGFFLLLFLPLGTQSQEFAGSIKFVQKTLSDTAYFTYHVKGNMVRMDMFEQGKVENSLLIDLNEKTTVALNHSRNIYRAVPVKRQIVAQNGYEVIKSKNSKQLHGYNCKQWRVRNQQRKTEVTYWVAQDNFFFFNDLLPMLNRSEKSSVFYQQIDGIEGYFPMQSVERSLLREERMRLEVVSIEKKQLPDSLFEIPPHYTPFKK